MAVNYLGYAQASNRNPIAEGLSSLGETLDRNAAMKRQAAIDARQASLADIQLQREQMALADMQREQQYKQGLRAAMSAPQTTTQFTPRQPEAPNPQAGMQSLKSVIMPNVGIPTDGLRNDMIREGLAPEVDASGFNMPQSQASPAVQAYNEGRVKTTTESPSAAGARYAMSQGRPEEAVKMISVDDALAQFAAKVQAGGGDPKQYYAAKADLDQAKEAFGIIKEFKGQPALLKSVWPAFIKAYPKAANIDLDNLEYRADGIVMPFKNPDGTPVPGKSYFYDNKGEIHQMENKLETQEKWSEPYMDKVGGKTVMLQKSSTGQIKPVVQDASTTVKVTTGAGGMGADAIDLAANQYLLTGQLPALGMGGATQKMTILNRAAKLAKESGLDASGIQAEIATTKANSGSLVQQQKQAGAMGSFVKNIDKQVSRFEDISKNIASFDTRLLNIPLRQVAERIKGSPDRAKINMYLTEISSETGKLASGATGSVAELSQGAREKWEKIHDPNLSMAQLLDLLKETRHAGQMRMQSVNEQINETKQGMRNRGNAPKPATAKDPLGIL